MTLNAWANFYMAQWDVYAKQNPLETDAMDIEYDDDSSSRPLFKSDDFEDYRRFRMAIQAIDLVVLDLTHLNYNPRHIIATVLYITLAQSYE